MDTIVLVPGFDKNGKFVDASELAIRIGLPIMECTIIPQYSLDDFDTTDMIVVLPDAIPLTPGESAMKNVNHILSL